MTHYNYCSPLGGATVKLYFSKAAHRIIKRQKPSYILKPPRLTAGIGSRGIDEYNISMPLNRSAPKLLPAVFTHLYHVTAASCDPCPFRIWDVTLSIILAYQTDQQTQGQKTSNTNLKRCSAAVLWECQFVTSTTLNTKGRDRFIEIKIGFDLIP